MTTEVYPRLGLGGGGGGVQLQHDTSPYDLTKFYTLNLYGCIVTELLDERERER